MNNSNLATVEETIEQVVEQEQIIEIKKPNIVYRFIKRAIDILAGLVGIILLVPITFIVWLIRLINKENDGPLFYSQTRVGKDGKVFKLYKFRSMVHNADEVLVELLNNEKYKEEWDKNQKFENDPRITKTGNFLRKSSFDELPQFVNVLKGDMSLIGPRPLVEGELDAHNGNHKIYEIVRPGISGWWGANGRSATDYEKRLELEYYYCKNCNLWLDIKCILLTIKAVLCGEGAI